MESFLILYHLKKAIWNDIFGEDSAGSTINAFPSNLKFIKKGFFMSVEFTKNRSSNLSRLVPFSWLETASSQNKPSKEVKISKIFKSVFDKEDFLKKIGVGIGGGIFGLFTGDQLAFLATKIGVIPEFNWDQMMTQMCVTISKIDRVVLKICCEAPIIEELVFRYGIQEILLKKIPEQFLQRFAPNKQAILDSKVVTLARIVFTAAIFAYIHLANKGNFPDSYCDAQVPASFIGGIVYGILKESKVGLLGSVVAHVVNNFFSMIEIFSYC